MGGPDELELPGGLDDMFGQFFEDGLVADEPLLVEDDLLVEAVLTAADVVDEFVVATLLAGAGAESAKAAAVPPPINDPDTPSTPMACLSFRRM
jgi:hypothetical protein